MSETTNKSTLRSRSFIILRFALSFLLLFVLTKNIDLKDLVSLFTKTVERLEWLTLALITPIAGILISSFRLKILLMAQRIFPSTTDIVRLNLIGNFYNQLFPSTIGGDIFRTYVVSRIRGKTSNEESLVDPILVSFTVIAVDRVVGAVGIILTGFIAALFNFSELNQSLNIILLLSVAFATLCLFFALPFLPAKKAGRLLFTIPFLAKLEKKAKTIYLALKTYRSSLRFLFYAILLSIALQCSIITQFWLLAQALQINVSFSNLATLIPIVTLISMIPITISGIGLRENALYSLGANMGLSIASSIALAWSFLIVKVLWALIGGILQLKSKQMLSPPNKACPVNKSEHPSQI